MTADLQRIKDPLVLGRLLWPGVRFSKEQIAIIYSVWENDETVVPAGNELGKDFVSGFISVVFFITRFPCKIVTTSATDTHLDVLWGEIGKFIRGSSIPLDSKQGGMLVCNERKIKKLVGGEVCPQSYIQGQVSSQEKIAAMQGQHTTELPGEFTGITVPDQGDRVPRTLFIADECSSVPDPYYKMAATWAQRMLLIGNCWKCSNFFKRAVKGDPATNTPGGDIHRPNGDGGYYRKVIRITGHDSPNVRLALKEIARGREPSGRIVIPGMLSYYDYKKRIDTWDSERVCVSIDANWYEGSQNYMYPADWIKQAEHYNLRLKVARVSRQNGTAMGVDSAAGGDNTAYAVVDDYGLLYLFSLKTPDTTKIVSHALRLMAEYKIPDEKVMFDYGGGGKQHVDRLRSMGHNVQAVMFGESPDPPLKSRGVVNTIPQRREKIEERHAYKNRRAEMYHLLRLAIEPVDGPLNARGEPTTVGQFCLPQAILDLSRTDGKATLRQQLAAIPLDYDEEGRIILIPKNRKPDMKKEQKTLTEIIGCSPDEADAVVLATFARQRRTVRQVASAH
jgi:hypothetical protein